MRRALMIVALPVAFGCGGSSAGGPEPATAAEDTAMPTDASEAPAETAEVPPEPESETGAAPSAPEPTAGEAQIAKGMELYGAKCAGCHGDSGQGTDKAPPVVGKGALPLDPPKGAKFRKAKFKTAADVFTFVQANMPPKKGGSLTDEEYTAIMAFALKANGVDLEGKVLDVALAQNIVLHE